MKINELERRVEEALKALPRMKAEGTLPPALAPLADLMPAEGFHPVVSLHHSDERKIRRDADVTHWDPASGGVWLVFEAPEDYLAGSTPASQGTATNLLPYLISVVERAERDPRLHFIALKFLRDRLLPEDWKGEAIPPARWNDLIADAIERGILKTRRVPNPKSPQFPVTAVSLNRSSKDVEGVLRAGPNDDAEFAPVDIEGEELSRTILDERR